MSIKDQQILNPRKLRMARFVSRISGSFKPVRYANAVLDKRSIKKILVQEDQCIGDVLMLEPALTAIRQAYTNADVDLLCVPAIGEVAKRAGLADRVLSYPNEAPHNERYDLAFDFHGDIRRLKRLKTYKSKFYAGFSFSGGAKLLTHVVDYPYNEHQVERPFALLEKLDVPVDRKIPELKGYANATGIKNKIILHPGANHEARQWPREHWIALVELLKEDRQDLIWACPPGDTPPHGIDVFQGSLDSLAELIAGASLLVGCDSMSVHLAAALGTPALAIFGSQDPELTKPYGPKGYVIIPEEECHHRRRDWRLCKECMNAVKPAEVFTKINSILTK